MPKMRNVVSSNVEAIGYNEAEQELHVRFRGGDTYVYHEVRRDAFEELMRAESKGVFLNQRVKGVYKFTRLPKTKTTRLEAILESSPGYRLELRGVRAADEDVEAAISWLKAWEIAAPFRPYSHLAQDEGTEACRALTLPYIKDLRQPVYDSRMVFIREDGEKVQEFLAVWELERAKCECPDGCDLSFLRAVWIVKPLILALPAGWVQEA